IFACVLLHEVGHTLHAQALGIPVRRIILLPIGGLAQLARLPEQPLDELRVAIAGPAANFGLALIFGGLAGVWMLAGPQAESPREAARLALQVTSPTPLGVLLYLTFANLGIAFFNLLPAFPMDGGRILRSLLALVLKRLTATRIVTWLGWLLGLVFVLSGLGAAQRWGVPASFGLALVGLFTLVGASVEETMEKSRLALRRIPARAAVRQPTWVLSPTDRLSPALAATAFQLQTVLPVVVSTRLVGLLTRKDLTAAFQRDGVSIVAHIMRTQFPYIQADEDLWHAQQLLAGADLSALPVLDGEALYGMLTSADIRTARLDPPSTLRIAEPIFIPGGNPTL
ncbi:MAG: site-2 protease family protein, partial [Anaerolineales bacterium]